MSISVTLYRIVPQTLPSMIIIESTHLPSSSPVVATRAPIIQTFPFFPLLHGYTSVPLQYHNMGLPIPALAAIITTMTILTIYIT